MPNVCEESLTEKLLISIINNYKGVSIYRFPVNGIKTGNLAVSKPFVFSFTRASLLRADAFLIKNSACLDNTYKDINKAFIASSWKELRFNRILRFFIDFMTPV